MASASQNVLGVPKDIALQTGPFLLGNLFGFGLYGILVVQIYIYTNNFPRDPLVFKGTVWFVLLVDTILTVFATMGAWNFLAAGWGDLNALAPLGWEMICLPFLSGSIATVLQFFYAWRIWKLRKWIVLPGLICFISVLSWGFASYVGFASGIVGITGLHDLQPYLIVWLSTSAAIDVIITVFMVQILLFEKRNVVFRESHFKLSRLITFTIETGMATSITALSDLILFAVVPTNNLHFIPFLMLAKLYSNTLLATLNARKPPQRVDETVSAFWNDSSQLVTTLHRESKNGVRISTVVEVDQGKDVEMLVFDTQSKKQERSDV